jgi:hypothetical protein
MSSNPSSLNRRRFIQAAGATAALGSAGGAARGVAIVLDPADSVAASAPARWAAKEFEDALSARGVAVHACERVAQAQPGDLCVLAAGFQSPVAAAVLKTAGVRAAPGPESLALSPGRVAGRAVLLASASDPAGLVYALLDLADRAANATDPLAALALRKPIVERPANAIRSIAKLFTSDVEDKPWYNDREMWPPYLTMLAAQRFNRFNLSLGIGYDSLNGISDAYFLFAYPFLLALPGYPVRVPQLPDAERDRNLEMLKFIGEQTVARGMRFQLGIWMHGYELLDSPKPNYTVEGLTRETHAPYCRDALRSLLKACPAIGGVTFRVHGESGVQEGSYDFWKTVFDGVSTCGRKVEIDMHAKGMDQQMIDVGLGSGMPVKISPKFWAEHMGMPYHQADIRALERPRPGPNRTGSLMSLSSGSRSFLRYGYGDLLREDRRFGVLHRVWPGTARLLMWGDPSYAAAYSRTFGFCGSDGVEVMEPLSFKGRKGSGLAGGRCGYADASLKPRWDWEKYAYPYRVWGRLLYNPDSDPEVWRRYTVRQFGAAAPALETALANASRILPIVTTAHGPSAANNNYWPEIYLNQSLVDAAHPGPYTDTPAPRVFGNVSPFDPQLFSRMNDFADALLEGEPSGQYSPIEVAQWIEDFAAAASASLAQAETRVAAKDRPEYRRMAVDIALQAGLGKFFGAKFRAGVLYRIGERTSNRAAFEESVKAYRAARAAWADLANRAQGVYRADVTFGAERQLRGHWLDRLPAIDADIAAVEAKLEQAKPGQPEARIASAIQAAVGRPRREPLALRHTPAAQFHPGQPLEIDLAAGRSFASVVLYYRRVTQEERFQTAPMQPAGNGYRATIPAAYTASPYPLQYYFELKAPAAAWLYPGFSAALANQPYFVVRRAG